MLLTAKQRKIRNHIEDQFDKQKPALVYVGHRGGSTTIMSAIAQSWHGPSIVIAPTVLQARANKDAYDKNRRLEKPYYTSVMADRNYLLNLAQPKTLVIFEALFWMGADGKMLYEQLLEKTPYIVALGSPLDNSWDALITHRAMTTLQLQPDLSTFITKEFKQKETVKFARDFECRV